MREPTTVVDTEVADGANNGTIPTNKKKYGRTGTEHGEESFLVQYFLKLTTALTKPNTTHDCSKKISKTTEGSCIFDKLAECEDASSKLNLWINAAHVKTDIGPDVLEETIINAWKDKITTLSGIVMMKNDSLKTQKKIETTSPEVRVRR
jgi:hypothetical protein